MSALPADLSSADVGAQRLFTLLDYSGVIVVVAPGKLGMASDMLSAAHIREIERKARPLCRTAGYTACIVKAGELATPLAKDDYSTTKRNAYIFWIVLLGGTGGLVAAAALTLNVRRKRLAANLHDLNVSARLAIDRAEAQVREQALAGASASREAPKDLQRAHELVLSAHHAAENPRSRVALREANEHAAEAIAIIDSVRGVAEAVADRSRCLYCGRDDRPPYAPRTIEDGHDRALDAKICSECMALLELGKTPGSPPHRTEGWWFRGLPCREMLGTSSTVGHPGNTGSPSSQDAMSPPGSTAAGDKSAVQGTYPGRTVRIWDAASQSSPIDAWSGIA